MKRFKNILVVAAREEATTRGLLASASQLARRNEASLTLFGVVEPVPMRRRYVQGNDGDLDVEMLLAESRLEELHDLAQESSLMPLAFGVANGPEFVEVIKRVVAFEHDLVITGSDAPSRTMGLTGASTTMHLLRKCPVPVWVDVEGSDGRPDVAVAVGPPVDTDAGGSMNTTLLELGSSLAARRNGAVHVVHAWRLPGESLFRKGRAGTTARHVDEMVATAHHEAELTLKRQMDGVPLRDAPIEVHLRKGEPADVIASVVDQHRPGVVVMGTLARTGIPGMIMGNTAERVLGTVDASILAVKPPGFVSPVVV